MTDKYILDETQDGSTSFVNTEFQESYHSSIGAYKEALHKHVLAVKLDELVRDLQNKNDCVIRLLDVCFGLGYNSGVAIEKIWEINPQQSIEITALESDPGIIEKISDLQIPENYHDVHKKLTSLAKLVPKMKQDPLSHNLLEYQEPKLSIKVLIDDARSSVKTLSENYFDAVFFDPFSPKSCPVLWTEEFILDVVKKAKTRAYISTYSSSRKAKDGFKNAGCELLEGPKLNRRNGGVLARKL